MGLVKHGEGEVLREPGQKTASEQEMTEEERAQLQRENDEADKAE